ncbi:MAG: serine/threonine-protein kinase [Rubrivivax sp.]
MPVAPRAGDTVGGHRLLRPIGRGAASVVWLAQAAGSDAAVALKLVPMHGRDTEADAADFLAAARRAASLVHPDILTVHDAGRHGRSGEWCWLSMEAVPGSDLSRYTTPTRLLPERLVLRLLRRLALALAHAHARGIVHRDLKPANVLVHWPASTLKLADFGLARSADAEPTRSGLLLGSPAYMAPEQLAGALPTPATDFHALGVLGFELLAGRLPYQGDSMGQLLQAVATQTPPELHRLRPGVPQTLAACVAALLAKQPAARPVDGDQLATDLECIDRAWPASQDA